MNEFVDSGKPFPSFTLLVFVQKITFILRKIHKNCCYQSCSFLAQICTESFVGWGFAPDPTGEAHSVPQDPLAVFRGLLLGGGGRERRGGEGEEWRRGEVTEGVRPLS